MEINGHEPDTWGRRSLRWTLVGTVFLFVTGLVILLAPFGTGAQLSVVVHTVLGLLFLWPLLVYFIPHLVARWRDKFSHFLLLGWIAGVLMIAAAVSGIVLTVQAAFGRRIDYGWDLVHIVSGCAVGVMLAAHLITAIRRNRHGFAVRLMGWTSLAGLVLAAVTFAGGEMIPSDAVRQPLPENYSMRYGENPFAPSLAKTDWLGRVEEDRRWIEFLEGRPGPERIRAFLAGAARAGGVSEDRIEALQKVADGGSTDPLLRQLREDLDRHQKAFAQHAAVRPAALAGSETCGTSGCHEQIYAEWQPSAHRYSSRSKFFQLIQGAMAESNGAESTRYCAGCHDPIALFSGAKNIYAADDDLSSAGADEGISCAVCHSIVRTDVRGNANYVLSPPVRYLAEDTFVGRFLIRAYPRHHKKSYTRPLMKTPEFCGACHKQFIDKEINRATRVQLQNQYDAWKGSHWFVPDEKNPQRADPEKSLVCNDCHMRKMDSLDPAHKEGKHRHHGYIAANQWLPKLHDLPHADKHVKLTEEWLQGKTVLPEIADRWPGGPPVPVTIEAPESVRPGEQVKIRIVADNRKVGHTFPTGPLDVIQSWFDVRVTFNGKEIFRSGALDKDGFITPGAFMLKAEGVDRAGHLIDRHNLWDMVGARFRRVLYPGYSDSEVFTFECACESGQGIDPAEGVVEAPMGEGELVVTAILKYRKVDQTLLNVLDPSGKSRAPVTDMTTAVKKIAVKP
jgi:hypothetical protein